MIPLQGLSSGFFRVCGHPSPTLGSSLSFPGVRMSTVRCAQLSGDWRKGFNPDGLHVGNDHHRRKAGVYGNGCALRTAFQPSQTYFVRTNKEAHSIAVRFEYSHVHRHHCNHVWPQWPALSFLSLKCSQKIIVGLCSLQLIRCLFFHLYCMYPTF